MADLTREEQKLIIKECIDEVWTKHKEEFWVDPEQHYLDHQLLRGCAANQQEMKANHEFVTELRRGTGLVKKLTLVTSVTTAISGFIYWVFYHLKNP